MSVLLNKTGLLYNPQLQSSEMTKKLFAIHQNQFELLLNKIIQEKENSIPQHHFIIGQRGTGKTTLLKRIEVELREKQYRKQFIPLFCREEQYNIKGLAEFWLNALDALADSLKVENILKKTISDIDKTIQELSRKTSEITSEEAYKYLMNTCQTLQRRPVLLIDNIGLVFSRLNSEKQGALRKLLSENGAPIIIGAEIVSQDAIVKYNEPFYDFFQIHYFKKLDYEEYNTLVKNLATVTESNEKVFSSIQENRSRQEALLELTGGTSRLAVMIFERIIKGLSGDIYDDLLILVDAITPFYKLKYEGLSEQKQIIVDAIALNWDAVSLGKLSMMTHIKDTQLSPQLKRLIDDGWIETTPAYEAKGSAYYISERFFNIFYLIRNGSEKHKDRLKYLSMFLESFYEANSLSGKDAYSSEGIQLQLALFIVKTVLNNKKLCEKSDLPNLSKGESFLELKKYEDALMCFNKVVESNHECEFFWILKGCVLDLLQRFKESVYCYEYAIKLNPKNENAWLGKGICLFKLKRYKDAINSVDKAIELFSLLIKKDEQAANKKFVCYLYLHKTQFELYSQNTGLAKENLLRMFEIFRDKENELLSLVNESWWLEFGSVVIKLDYGSWLLAVLEEKKYDIVLSPYYTALQFLEIEKQNSKDSEKEALTYLLNRATEINYPAMNIVGKMRKYIEEM